MEYIPIKSSPICLSYGNRIILHMILTDSGVLVAACKDPHGYALEMHNKEGTLIGGITFERWPQCLLCKGELVFCAQRSGDILVVSATDCSIVRRIERTIEKCPFSLILWDSYLISYDLDNTARWWCLNSWRLVREQTIVLPVIYSMAMGPLGVIALGAAKHIILLDVLRGHPPSGGLLKGHAFRVSCLLWQNERRLVSGSWDGNICIWDITTETRLTTLMGHERPVFCLARRGPILVSTSTDNTARVWSLETHTCLQIIKTRLLNANRVMFSDSSLLSGGESGQILRWSGGYLRMSKESIMTFLLCRKHSNCPAFVHIPMDIIKIVVGMVDRALMWGEG